MKLTWFIQNHLSSIEFIILKVFFSCECKCQCVCQKVKEWMNWNTKRKQNESNFYLNQLLKWISLSMHTINIFINYVGLSWPIEMFNRHVYAWISVRTMHTIEVEEEEEKITKKNDERSLRKISFFFVSFFRCDIHLCLYTSCILLVQHYTVVCVCIFHFIVYCSALLYTHVCMIRYFTLLEVPLCLCCVFFSFHFGRDRFTHKTSSFCWASTIVALNVSNYYTERMQSHACKVKCARHTWLI